MDVLTVPEAHTLYLTKLKRALAKRGIRVVEAPFPYVRWPRNGLRLLIRFLQGPDVCQLHYSVFDSELAMRWFFATQVPKVWTVHNLLPHRPQFRDDLAVTAAYLNHVKVAIWHSARTIEQARALFAGRGLPTAWTAQNVIVPHMSYNGDLPDRVSREEARKALGFRDTDFVAGHFGPTGPYKGTETFLELLPLARHEDVLFTIFGRCDHAGLLEKIAQAERTFPNLKTHLAPVSDEELQYWFRACDVVVEPYLDITTSGSIMFPIAFSTPVIASPRGNVPDLIRPGETGWLATGAEEVYRCLREAKTSPEAARRMGQRAHALVDEIARIDLVADAYAGAYETAMRR